MTAPDSNDFKDFSEIDRWVGLYKDSHAGPCQGKKWAILQSYTQKRVIKRLKLCTELIDSYKNLDVLDLGCGSGHYGVVVTKGGGNWFGLDLSFGMLIQSRKLLTTQELSFCLVNGDIRRLPFNKESFDLIFCVGILSYFKNQTAVEIVNQVSTFLRPGGKMILQTGRFDILTWLRSRLPQWTPRPIRLPGPLYPRKPRLIIRTLENSSLRLSKLIEIKKYQILPYQTIYLFEKRSTL